MLFKNANGDVQSKKIILLAKALHVIVIILTVNIQACTANTKHKQNDSRSPISRCTAACMSNT